MKKKKENMNYELSHVKNIAKSWNNLDTRFIEKKLSNNFIYKSEWMTNSINGKETYLSYLKLKFEALK